MTFRFVVVSLAFLAFQKAVPAQTLFRFPAIDPTNKLFLTQPIIHVDHDPEDKKLDVECVNYDGVGFPWCYDQHDGTDFLLASGFLTMDTNDVQVVAAADGVVTEALDGNYDRCHGEGLSKVSCDGHPMVANRVVLRHADGLETSYYHLKKGSVKVKQGQKVSCGELLGYVGSSGISATPHLHFEVRDNLGEVVDPFAGPKSQAQSYWTQQVGGLGRPGDYCQGAPIPVDAAPLPDPDLGGTTADSVPSVHDADPNPSLPRAGGCAVGGVLPPPTLLLLLFGFVFLVGRSSLS